MALQQGVMVPLKRPTRIGVLVRRILNVDGGAFEREVKTLMLNNRVVDDPDVSLVSPGDVLVLSGAMPGLVGAMLRTDSPIKAMRSTITAEGAPPGNRGSAEHSGFLLKAFNTILRRHLEDILDYGVYRVP